MMNREDFKLLDNNAYPKLIPNNNRTNIIVTFFLLWILICTPPKSYPRCSKEHLGFSIFIQSSLRSETILFLIFWVRPNLRFGAENHQNIKSRIVYYFFLILSWLFTLQNFTFLCDSESWRYSISIISSAGIPFTDSAHAVEIARSIGTSRTQPPPLINSISLFRCSWITWCSDIQSCIII